MKELLFSVTKKDLEITYFSGTGAGGQHRNKHQNCVRMYHADSGVRVTGQSNRERAANIQQAFKTLINHPKFKIWYNMQVQSKLSVQSIDDIVAKKMQPQNLKIEGKNAKGQWSTDSVRRQKGA